MNKRPFTPKGKDNRAIKGGPSSEKPFQGAGKPYKKSTGGPDKAFHKPFDKEERPYKKTNSDKPERPFKKTSGSAGRPARKPFDKEERPFKKPFDPKSSRPYKKSSDSEEKPYRKPFDKEKQPFKKPFGPKSEKPPYKKTFDSEDKPYRKSFDKESRPFKKTDKPFPKPFDKEGKSSGKGGKAIEKPFPKKRKPFGKFEEEDLSFGKKLPRQDVKPEQPKEDEVTFSKSIEKWETAPVKPSYGSVEKKFHATRQRGEKDKFKRHFDQENSREKAYSANPGNTGNYSRRQATRDEDYYSEKATEGEMPLNKYLAHCDVCSRRDAVQLIKAGKVKVNGELIVEPGHKVTAEDQVTLSGKKLSIQKNLLYILLNKPKGYITTTDDPQGRRTVLDIFENQIDQRIFPVGRLDRNTTGLLLLTNDGELTQQLSHPKFEIKKVYQVALDKNLSDEDFDKIKAGVILEDGPAPVDQLAYLEDKKQLGLEIHNGKNRIVRRIFESLGYEVEKLDRVMYAGLTKKNLIRGKWRFLSKQEVINLKHFKK